MLLIDSAALLLGAGATLSLVDSGTLLLIDGGALLLVDGGTLLLINSEALLLIDSGTLLLISCSALPLVDSGALLLALRLQEAHGGVAGGQPLDQATQLVWVGDGHSGGCSQEQQEWHLNRSLD